MWRKALSGSRWGRIAPYRLLKIPLEAPRGLKPERIFNGIDAGLKASYPAIKMAALAASIILPW